MSRILEGTSIGQEPPMEKITQRKQKQRKRKDKGVTLRESDQSLAGYWEKLQKKTLLLYPISDKTRFDKVIN